MENMDRVREELDEAKLEIEKLKAEYESQTEQHESLKKAYNEQLGKLEEANSKLENSERELFERAEEVDRLKQMYEELQQNFAAKESAVNQLSAANDKLRDDIHNTSDKIDEDNISLISSVEEANSKFEEQERKIVTLEEENNRLKGLFDSFEKKCSEAEERAKSPKELRDRDDVISNLEEELRNLEDGLKWKKEQFQHLEEAHEKLRGQYNTEKKEWESEKCALIDEIGSLQERLESQTRISEDLGKKLEMCSQALAREEGRRKAVEVQVSDFNKMFDDVSMEGEEAEVQSEGAVGNMNEEIASLRYSLRTKEADYREVQYRASQLELENKELLASLKELQEAQIHGGGKSLTRTKSKLKSVEQMHRDCSSTFEDKVETLTCNLDKCKLELTTKEIQLEEARKNLEHSDSLLMNLVLQNEEIHVMLLVLKLGIGEIRKNLQGQVMEDNVSLSKKQLETKNKDLAAAYREVFEEHQKLKAQLEKHKEILEEALQMESASEEIIQEAYDALDKTHAELAEKVCEANEMEFELHIWKSAAERLMLDLDNSQFLRKEIEVSLIAQAEVEDAIRREKGSLIDLLAEKDNMIDCLEQKINVVEQEIKMGTLGENWNEAIVEDLLRESFKRELESTLIAQISTERAFEHERSELFETIEAKEHRIEDLMQTMNSLEQKFDNSSLLFASQLAEKQAEIELLNEAWERINAAEILVELEIEEKKMMVGELENEVNALMRKLESQGESLMDSKKRAEKVEAALEAREMEMRELASEAETRMESSDSLINELRRNMADLLGERDSLVGFVKGLDETIGECCHEDAVLIERLRNCLKLYDEHPKGNTDHHVHCVGAVKRYEVTPERSPFRELNSCS